MPNDNLTALISNFATGNPGYGYRSASVGAFNTRSSAGGFQAYCNLMIDSAIFSTPATPPTAQWLWGNADDAGHTGWAIRLIVTGTQLNLSAQVGDGSTFSIANYALTGANRPNPSNRLIHAGLALLGGTCYLLINGNIVASAGAGAIAYVASQYGACLGMSTPANSTIAAPQCAVAACGFATWNMSGAAQLANMMGESFLAEQAVAGNGNLMNPDYGIDWQHRYSAKSAVTGLPSVLNRAVPPTVAVAPGVDANRQLGYPLAGTSIEDIGNRTTSALSGFTTTVIAPVALLRTGNGSPPEPTQQPVTKGRKNLSWYDSGAITFT